MKNKRFLVLMLGLFMLLGVVGCSNKKLENNIPITTSIENEEESKINDIKLIQEEKREMKKIQLEENKKLKELAKQEEERKIQEEKEKQEKQENSSSNSNKSNQPSNNNSQPNIQNVPVSNLQISNNSEQLIVITKTSNSSYSALCSVYEKVNGEWKYVWKNLRAVTGNNGISYNRREGDRTTPAGVFTISQAFGKANNPGTKLPYRVVQQDDWWAGDSQHPESYNTWQKSPSNGWRESESEHLIDYDLYKYAFVIDFNTSRTPYNGSAIFFHIAPYSGRGTAGCVGVNESDLVNILKWINPSKNPKIIICNEGELGNF